MAENILKGTTCYLIGSIESATDYGKGWRNLVKGEFSQIGIKCFDPCDKPFVKDISETENMQSLVKKYRAEKNYDKLAEVMKDIRKYDLRLCDLATFGFAYLDADVSTCGSWEEITWMVARLNKPLFLVYKQGKDYVPLWMYGVMPHRYFYDSLEDAIKIVKNIDNGTKQIDSDRWRLLRPEFR